MFKYLRLIFSNRFIPRMRPIFWKWFYNKSSSSKALIYKPLIFSPKYVTYGKGVYIFKHARIQCVTQYNDIKYNPSVILKDGVSIQQNCHITCAERIEIGANTAIASNVTITDIDHPYIDINTPIEKQDLKVKRVFIGKDTKIYNNAVILQGSIIGKHCVIGANAVVTHDIPDYSVAVGMPAKVIKRYNQLSGKWEKTNPDGSFIEK